MRTEKTTGYRDAREDKKYEILKYYGIKPQDGNRKNLAEIVRRKISNKISWQKGKKSKKYNDLKDYAARMRAYDDLESIKANPLIRLKSYDIEQGFKRDDLFYLINFYGMTPAFLKRNLIKLRRLNSNILETIDSMKEDIEYLFQHLFDDKNVPQAKKWFVKMFGAASKLYLKDWQKHRGSYNKPDFEASYIIFKGHESHDTPLTQYGLGRAAYNKYRYQKVPQGKIYFLFLLHSLLYGPYEKHMTLLNAKAEEIKKILENLSNNDTEKIINLIRGDGYAQKSTGQPALSAKTAEIYKILRSN